MRVISGHLGWVRSVTVEPGNKWFATGAGDRTIKVKRQFAQWVLSKMFFLLTYGLDLGLGFWYIEAFTYRTYQHRSWNCSVQPPSVFVFLRRG